MAHDENLETAQSPKSPFPFWIWGWDFGLGLGLRLVNNYSKNVYLFIDTNLIKNVKSILFMFLSTKVILNTRGTFLKKSSFLCTGCKCLLPCDISRIKSNVQKEDSRYLDLSTFILTCRDCSSHYTPG